MNLMRNAKWLSLSLTLVAAFVMACSCNKDHGIIYPTHTDGTDTTS